MIHFKKWVGFALVMALFLPSVSRSSPRAQVLIRGEGFIPEIQEVELPDLISKDRFLGRYFKIVKGVDEEAILIEDQDPQVRLKAATVYYHLNRARDFWVQQMHSDFVKKLPMLTIRIEMSRSFSDLAHYQRESIEPEVNNALSIPAGVPMDGLNLNPWGNEIWFRPMKKIFTRDLPESGLGVLDHPISTYLKNLSKPLVEGVARKFIQTSVQSIFYPTTLNSPYPNLVLGQIGTLALAELIIQGSHHLDSWFMEKYYYLDTAMVPEIIYHEFSHVALSDYLSLTLSTPILEGFADYFATAISGNPMIASNIKEYSLSMPKNGRSRMKYHPDLEALYFSNSDFVLSVLWLVKEAFPEVSNELIIQASQSMNTHHSDIRHDLVRSLLSACLSTCLNPREDRLRLFRIFEEKGF